MECACEIDGYGEACEFTTTTYPIAKKEHKCDECKRTIKRKEKYQHIKGMFEGDFFTHKVCSDCQSVIKTFFCGWSQGSVWDDLYTYFYDESDYINWKQLEKVTPVAKDKILDMIQKIWDREND